MAHSQSERNDSEPDRPARDVPAATFEEFFAREYPSVVGLAAVLCGRRPVAEELAQEAFIAALRRWDRIAAYDNPGAWVRRVAVNLATSSLRRRAGEARAMIRLSSRREPAPDLTADDEEFWRCVRDLPRRQAQCVALRYLEDRSTADIADVLGIAEATVRVHLHAGRVALSLRLGEQAEEETP